MRQLKYDYDFNNIVDDIKIWNDDEIPVEVKEFINKISDSKIIYNQQTKKHHCPQCFQELSENYYCENCNMKIDIRKYDFPDIISVNDLEYGVSNTNEFYYYVFDVDSEIPLLYEIKQSIYLYNTTHLLRISKINIDKVFLVNNDCLIELLTNKRYSYKEVIKEKEYASKLIDAGDFDLLENEEQPLSELFFDHVGYLYVDNLLKLKSTIYRYTFIWETTKYLKVHAISLHDITALPLTNPCFEYLVKYRLYNLAYGDELLEFKKTFKDTFGVEKSHLNFMVKNDIGYHELMILSFTGVEDIKLLRKLSQYCYVLRDISQTYRIKIIELINYFKKKHYKYDYLYEYADYIRMCNELKYNLKDKRTIFPDNLLKEHNKVFSQYEIVKDSIIEEKIINVGKVLQVNKYEDNDYIIYPAPTLQSMIDESFNQSNCLKSYCEKYSNGETNIYFMRDKKSINKSLVTIEVRDNKVVQARIKNNALPSNDLINIISVWEKKLIPIEFEKCSI